MEVRLFKYLESHFGLLLTLAFPLGLFVPAFARVPDEGIAVLVSCLIFLSCFKTDLAQLRDITFMHIVGFWLLRFLLLAVPLYYLFGAVSEEGAQTALLLTLMPAGVASPALCAILGGNVSLAISVVVFSHLICPLTVPLVFWLLTDQVVQVSPLELFSSLSMLVFIPIGIHLPLRKTAFAARLAPVNSGLSVLIVALMVVLVTAMQREFFLEYLQGVLSGLLILGVLYGIFYFLVWFAARRITGPDRLAFVLCSGANNNALGISLAALYFPPGIAVLMVLSEVPWVLAVVVMRKIVGVGIAREKV